VATAGQHAARDFDMHPLMREDMYDFTGMLKTAGIDFETGGERSKATRRAGRLPKPAEERIAAPASEQHGA
jgi:hypothetical protein